jgi:hypothetical protein
MTTANSSTALCAGVVPRCAVSIAGAQHAADQDGPRLVTDLATTSASRTSPRLVALAPSGVYEVGTNDRGPGI